MNPPEKPTPTRLERSELGLPGSFGPLVKVSVALLLVALIVLTVRGRVWDAFRGNRIEELVSEAKLAIEAKQWEQAVIRIREARELKADHPELWRVTTQYLDQTGLEPVLQIQTLRRLREAGVVVKDDDLLEGRALLRLGDLERARMIWEKLPSEEKQTAAALEFQAAIQLQEGEKEKAHATTQLAAQSKSDDPLAAFHRAKIGLDSTIPERRASALAEMAALSMQKDATGLEALRLLIERNGITASEAEKLLTAFEAHPKHDLADRLSALSAIMRADPARRDAVLRAEVAAQKGKSLDVTLLVARWLAHEKEHLRVLDLAPRDVLLKEKDLFPIFLQSMAEAGRWREMRELFENHRSLPMKEEGIQVWKALAASRLEPTLKQAEHHLRLAFTGSISSKNHATLRAAAQVAEDLELWELAYEGYSELSRPELGTELEMLEKCWKAATATSHMNWQLDTARRLRVLRPTSVRFANRLDYLRLLLGDEIEAAMEWREVYTDESADERHMAALLLALKAYRMNDKSRMLESLAKVGDAASLPPGQRAVLAGLLASGGDVGRAYQLAEKVQESLLSPVERGFLKKAL
jgi:hypothetical protein